MGFLPSHHLVDLIGVVILRWDLDLSIARLTRSPARAVHDLLAPIASLNHLLEPLLGRAFLWSGSLAAAAPARWLVLDGTESVSAIEGRVWTRVEALLS